MMLVKRIPGCVVNPFNTGLRVKLMAISGSTVWARTLDGQSMVKLNLEQGLVYEADPDEYCYCQGWTPREMEHNAARERMRLPGLDFEERARLERIVDRFREKSEWLLQFDPEKLGILVALVTARVSGSEVVKGLNSRGFETSCKVTANYLGGWDFIMDDALGERRLNAEGFIYECHKKAEQVRGD